MRCRCRLPQKAHRDRKDPLGDILQRSRKRLLLVVVVVVIVLLLLLALLALLVPTSGAVLARIRG